MAFPVNHGNQPHTQQNNGLNNNHPFFSQMNAQSASHALNILAPKNSQSQTNGRSSTNNLSSHSHFAQSIAQGRVTSVELQMYRQQLMQQRYLQNLNGIPNGNVAMELGANMVVNNPIIPTITNNDSLASSKKNHLTIDLTENDAGNKEQMPSTNISTKDVARNPGSNANITASQQNKRSSFQQIQKAARLENQAAMHMAQFSPAAKSCPSLGTSYGICSILGFKPQNKLLAELFSHLSPSEGHTLLNLNFIRLRPSDKPPTPQSRLISKAYCTYLSTKQNSSQSHNPKQLYALTCNGCYVSGCERPQWVHFPSSCDSLVPIIRLMAYHLASCPYTDPRIRNQIMGREVDPRFSSKISLMQYLPPFCTMNKLFIENKKLPMLYSRQSIYDNNMVCMEEARECATMNLRGVLASEVCDLVDIDPIEDPPFILFICECFELARLGKHAPEYAYFSKKLSSTTNNESDLFVLRCNCCHGEGKNGNPSTFDPTGIALLQNSEQSVADVTRLVFNHFKTCLKGHKRSVYNILKPSDPSGSNIIFQNFVKCLHMRLKALMGWVEEMVEESNQNIDPRKDTELWVSLSTKQVRELWGINRHIPVSSLMTRTEDNGLGSAILECDIFPKYGLLHETIDFPTLSDMKSQRFRKKKRSREAKKHFTGGKVEDLDYLPILSVPPSFDVPKRRRIREKEKPLIVQPIEQLPIAGGQDKHTGTDVENALLKKNSRREIEV
mmetsp:Transcript_7493/g.10903  ORF Transcript_7493/g.10903 Transcript_7493/m.10903 type:complete len:727 (+) Transcript_7493:122-2302(+)